MVDEISKNNKEIYVNSDSEYSGDLESEGSPIAKSK